MSGPVVLKCLQGSPEWHEARLGIPTASQFSRIITPARLKLSEQRIGYMAELLVEWLTGAPATSIGSMYWIERGHRIEPEARDWYAMERNLEAESIGMVYLNERRRVGASPDSLVGDDGLLEIKCPSPKHHMETWLRGAVPTEHIPQLQGQLWVTGRDWLDFMSYSHDEETGHVLPPFVTRVEPDPKWHAALDEHVPQFIHELADACEKLKQEGYGR